MRARLHQTTRLRQAACKAECVQDAVRDDERAGRSFLSLRDPAALTGRATRS